MQRLTALHRAVQHGDEVEARRLLDEVRIPGQGARVFSKSPFHALLLESSWKAKISLSLYTKLSPSISTLFLKRTMLQSFIRTAVLCYRV